LVEHLGLTYSVTIAPRAARQEPGRAGAPHSTVTGLQQYSDDGTVEHCVHCGALAVGPCARCHAPVCGDCCVLTEGGARTYAVCLDCERRAGRSLRSAWLAVATWLLLPMLALLLAIALLSVLVRG
jgi:hypothetical protein